MQINRFLILGKYKIAIQEFPKVIIIIAITAQLVLSAGIISRWFSNIIKSCLIHYNTPKENRIFTTSFQEYEAILEIRKNLPENATILWIPKVSPIINYYIYPRKIFQIKEYLPDEKIEIERDFLKARNIKYIFFDYGKLYSIENLEIFEGTPNNKVIITRK